MLETLANSIFGFILAIGILVTVHEFGHFWVARRLGVKVLRFSIGFGKPLLTWHRRHDDTEYVLAAIPLGGYVKMLDEREADVPREEAHRAFNRQPLWVRTAVVLAGPMFNLLFAVFLFWLVLVLGETGLKPVVGEVQPGTPAAAAGFEPGEQILRINGRETPTWSQMLYHFASAAATGDAITMDTRDRDQRLQHRKLAFDAIGDMAEVKNPLKALGITPEFPVMPAVIGKVLPGEPAEKAGLKVGDRILKADGKPMESWSQWVRLIRARPLQPMRVEIERDGQVQELELVPGVVDGAEGKAVGRIGAANQPMPELWKSYRVEYSLGPLEALPVAVTRTWDFSVLTFKVMWRIVSGQASLKNLGGPITMADAAGSAVSAGLVSFVRLLAIISVSLGVFNLLPIPVLDGGHLFYFLIEAVSGKPPSEDFMLRGQQIGLALLLSLMVLVFYQDIARLVG
ncbi:RIP metalloprotease RseP [Thiolapillus brandeum]|uniref:Zinc metalloprotease n=1 Tax=Thiolapillus brandeum TaxID=1076588 RepID=A0A7U6GI71_9GAMM|nr:RIP metalloprotease RseP [Thiolapillus brandeum]BAO44085.1 regulator of sigma E protease [Thiolapillus brandeum]